MRSVEEIRSWIRRKLKLLSRSFRPSLRANIRGGFMQKVDEMQAVFQENGVDITEGRLKMRDWNYRHHQKCRGGKCGTKRLKAKTPTCYGSHNMIYLIICQNLQCSVCFYISCVYVCLFFISVLLYYTL